MPEESTKSEAAKQFINVNYLGMFAGFLSIVVTAYNINNYLLKIKEEKRKVK